VRCPFKQASRQGAIMPGLWRLRFNGAFYKELIMKRIVVIAGIVLAISALILAKRRAKRRNSSPAH